MKNLHSAIENAQDEYKLLSAESNAKVIFLEELNSKYKMAKTTLLNREFRYILWDFQRLFEVERFKFVYF